MHPHVPGMSLLKPGAKLTGAIIARLRSLGMSQLWVEDDLTTDLDAAITPELTMAKMEVYSQLKRDLTQISRKTISTTQILSYREAVIGLVRELVAIGKLAGLTDQIFATESGLFSHSSNVAYLAILVGLELESYLVHERPKVSAQQARDVVNLGLAGMLHDIGKVGLSSKALEIHEVLGHDEDRDGSEYDRHPLVGCEMLRQGGYRLRQGMRCFTTTSASTARDGRTWPSSRGGACLGHRLVGESTSSLASSPPPTC